MKKLILTAALVVLTGQGCMFNARTEVTPPPVAPIPTPDKCPDVCAAICAGQPEPEIPQGCALPMCACDPQPKVEVKTEAKLEINTGTTKPAPTPKPAPAPTPAPAPAPAPAPTPKTYSVTIQNMAYGTASLTVNKGDKVTFTNRDQMTHTVTSDAGKFNGSVDAGQSFTLDTSNLAPGTYPYHCTPHPWMTGTITVK